MHLLVYVSDAVRPVTPDDLEAIAAPARTANAADGVTGLLVHAEGMYLQALEGTEAAVEAAYARALSSTRHRRLRRAPLREVRSRRCDGFEVGFAEAAPTHVATLLLEPLVSAGHLTHEQAAAVLLARWTWLQARVTAGV